MNTKTQDFKAEKTSDKVYLALTSEDDGRVCRDIPESACDQQPENFLRHVMSLSAFKFADGLVDPKLILTWLFVQLGATAQQIGYLVPIREAGALLPQLAIAQWVRRRDKRKLVWAFGASAQGIAFLGMALSILLLESSTAVLMVLLCLAIMATARSFCSVSYKDVLGKTISKSVRGTATGTSSSISSFCVFFFGLILTFVITEMTINMVVGILILAAILCFAAALNFLRIDEQSGAIEGGENAIDGILSRIKAVLTERQFQIFLFTRACLICTALAPPFILMLPDFAAQQLAGLSANTTDEQLLFNGAVAQELGLLILASSLSGTFSSYLWGKWTDQSSRRVLLMTSFMALIIHGFVVLSLTYQPDIFTAWMTTPLVLFSLMTIHHGVRISRSTHLVDMSDESNRANYTAVSNTIIGIVLAAGVVFGYLANSYGLLILFGLFAIMALCAAIAAYSLDEVQ